MRKQGTRVDDLTKEGKPGYVRIIRFGNFQTSEGSEEMIMNELDAEDLASKLNEYFAKKLGVTHYGGVKKNESKKDTKGKPARTEQANSK
jgi:hypothetical protein